MASVAQIFGSALRRIRTQRGVTQKELGAMTRISHTFIGEMERGMKAPNLEVVVAIARALNVPIEDLVSGLTANPSEPATAEPHTFRATARMLPPVT